MIHLRISRKQINRMSTAEKITWLLITVAFSWFVLSAFFPQYERIENACDRDITVDYAYCYSGGGRYGSHGTKLILQAGEEIFVQHYSLDVYKLYEDSIKEDIQSGHVTDFTVKVLKKNGFSLSNRQQIVELRTADKTYYSIEDALAAEHEDHVVRIICSILYFFVYLVYTGMTIVCHGLISIKGENSKFKKQKQNEVKHRHSKTVRK